MKIGLPRPIRIRALAAGLVLTAGLAGMTPAAAGATVPAAAVFHNAVAAVPALEVRHDHRAKRGRDHGWRGHDRRGHDRRGPRWYGPRPHGHAHYWRPPPPRYCHVVWSAWHRAYVQVCR